LKHEKFCGLMNILILYLRCKEAHLNEASIVIIEEWEKIGLGRITSGKYMCQHLKKILSCAFDYECEKMIDDGGLSKKLIVNRAFLYDYR